MAEEGSGVRFSTFQADVTPPLGSPVGNGSLSPAKAIIDPLSARGIIFYSGDTPIVLCALDWVQTSNEGYSIWCEKMAEAAGTSPDRVSVHSLHPHDAPSCDFSAESLLEKNGLGGVYFDSDFDYEAVERVVEAVSEAAASVQVATHLGIGKARVNRVASSRRILGPEGRVKHVRYSSCRDEAVRAAPEGVIDPYLRNLSLWNGDQPLVSLTYYATHPQSFYGRGAVSPDFVGLARNLREATLPEVAHIHFNGAGGNVAAGKYNDGSPTNRFRLARRLAEGMEDAWEATVRLPLAEGDLAWKQSPVELPLRGDLKDREKLLGILEDPGRDTFDRIRAARDLAWSRRCAEGEMIDLYSLRLGTAQILFMPGELFVEYQLQVEKMASSSTDCICMAAYGDGSPGYIGTEASYTQGGYETGRVSRVAPGVESVLIKGMSKLVE